MGEQSLDVNVGRLVPEPVRVTIALHCFFPRADECGHTPASPRTPRPLSIGAFFTCVWVQILLCVRTVYGVHVCSNPCR